MSRLRILLTRRWPECVETHLRERFDTVTSEQDQPLDADAMTSAMHEFDVLCPTVSDRLGPEVLRVANPRVKLIANYGVGFDHIDLASCRRRQITVTNTPGVLTEATADLALTLLLMTARRASEGERELRAGSWTGWRPTHLLGASVSGKTLGLVGFGRIAQAVAARARLGFGMRIIYYARRAADSAVAQSFSARHVDTLDHLAARSDYISLHLPGGDETRHLIGRQFFDAMKSDGVFINTARGEIVDHDALAEALEKGWIGAAGLDVYPAEPTVPPALLDAPNLVLLPHLGSATKEAREAMGMRAAANIEAWAQGRQPLDRVA